jgi:hypothetical protein
MKKSPNKLSSNQVKLKFELHLCDNLLLTQNIFLTKKKLLNLNKSLNLINCQNQQRNYLLLHEYVSMGLLQEFGINIPKFKVATTPAQVKEFTSSGG